MNSTAKAFAFWVVTAFSALLRYMAALQSQHLWFDLAEIWVGVLLILAAAWPLLTRRPMRVQFVAFTRSYALPMALQVTFQLLYVAIAALFWWRAALDIARTR